MGAKFCIENKTDRAVVIQIEQISIRYCCWIEPGKRTMWHPNRKGPQMHQGIYTLRVIEPSLNYKTPNMAVEDAKTVVGGLLIGAGGAGIVASAVLIGVGISIAGIVVGATAVGVASIATATGGFLCTCTAREYRPAVKRALCVGRGTKCEIRHNNNQFDIIMVCVIIM